MEAVQPPWREMPWTVAFWVVYVAAFSLETRWLIRGRGGEGSELRDRGSCFAIIGAMFVAVALAFWYASRGRAFALTWHPHAWFVAGLALMVTGAAIRQWAMSTLGRRFTGVVVIQSDHALIETGPYRYVRHPSYTGAFLMWLGLGLALTNGVSLAALALAAIIAYGLRVRTEEAALCEAFGAQYRDYMKRTRRFLPGLF